MSKTKSRDNFRRGVKSANRWEQAIADAESVIEKSESKIKEMRRAIRAFQRMRDAGEPWPGSEEAQGVVNDALKRDASKASV
jgi:hypothetical protein